MSRADTLLTRHQAGVSVLHSRAPAKGDRTSCRMAAQRPSGAFTAEEAEGSTSPNATGCTRTGGGEAYVRAHFDWGFLSSQMVRAPGQRSGERGHWGQRTGEKAARAWEDQASDSDQEPGGGAGKTRGFERARYKDETLVTDMWGSQPQRDTRGAGHRGRGDGQTRGPEQATHVRGGHTDRSAGCADGSCPPVHVLADRGCSM